MKASASIVHQIFITRDGEAFVFLETVSKRGLTLSDPAISFGLRGVSKGSDPFLKQSLRPTAEPRMTDLDTHCYNSLFGRSMARIGDRQLVATTKWRHARRA
jgi:hypothetical protein